MKLISVNTAEQTLNVQLTITELDDILLYIGHGRHAKALDRINYLNIGWNECAKTAENICNDMSFMMQRINDVYEDALLEMSKK